MIEYEKIDLLVMKSRGLENNKVRRPHMSRFQSSRAAKLSQLLLHLYNILIKTKEEDSKIKLNTVCKLAKIMRRYWWLSLDVTDIIYQRSKRKREYNNMKRASGTIR